MLCASVTAPSLNFYTFDHMPTNPKGKAVIYNRFATCVL